jgi:ribosomal protein L7/L12
MENPFPKDDIEEIKRAILAGDKIGAIKLYREKTHVGLAEAKTAVEQLQTQLRGFASAELSLPKAAPAPAVQTGAISEALFAGDKILAIKLYREQTHAGLADAKRAVEQIEAHLRASAPGLFGKPSGKGCLVSLCFVATLGVTLWKALS